MPNLCASALRRIWSRTSGQPDKVALAHETELLRTYHALRAKGHPAVHALPWARAILTTRDFERALPESTGVNGPLGWGQRWEFEEDGWSYVVDIAVDDSMGRPEDEADCYDADDIGAWERELWHFYVVRVEATNGLASAVDILGGIDAGYYFQSSSLLTEDQQLWSAILDHDMLGNARSDALDTFEAKMRKAL